MDKREVMVGYLQSFMGLQYRWGGNGVLGIDCSGLACEGLKSVGLINVDMKAISLWKLYAGKKVAAPQIGCMAFFGSGDEIFHVGICVDSEHMIEAGGGLRETDTPQEAEALGAMVRIRPIHRRKDLVGLVDPFI